jgi:hypothetical protein
METNYLKWNLPNWITVVLMVSIAYVAYGLASQSIKQYTMPS